jgi:hypothetical protein
MSIEIMVKRHFPLVEAKGLRPETASDLPLGPLSFHLAELLYSYSCDLLQVRLRGYLPVNMTGGSGHLAVQMAFYCH